MTRELSTTSTAAGPGRPSPHPQPDPVAHELRAGRHTRAVRRADPVEVVAEVGGPQREPGQPVDQLELGALPVAAGRGERLGAGHLGGARPPEPPPGAGDGGAPPEKTTPRRAGLDSVTATATAPSTTTSTAAAASSRAPPDQRERYSGSPVASTGSPGHLDPPARRPVARSSVVGRCSCPGSTIAPPLPVPAQQYGPATATDHSGRTRFGPRAEPRGAVIVGVASPESAPVDGPPVGRAVGDVRLPRDVTPGCGVGGPGVGGRGGGAGGDAPAAPG